MSMIVLLRSLVSPAVVAAAILMIALLDPASCRGLRAAERPADDWRLPAEQRREVEALGAVLIDAANATDEAVRQKLISSAWSAATLARDGSDRLSGQLKGLARLYPGLRFERAEMTEFRHDAGVRRYLHVYARRPGDKLWRDVQVQLDSGPPVRLDKIVFVAEVTEPIALPNGDITSASTLAWLNDDVDRLVREHDLSAALLVARGEGVILERYVGFADSARARPVGPDTIFNLASASKMFTALAIAKLVSDGKLRYGRTIAEFFPDFPDQAHLEKTTIGHLLSHTSGIGEYWTAETASAVRAATSTRDMLPLVEKAGIRFAPGTQFEYSNSNFILAGLILEQVTGLSYEEAIDRLIVTPLGLTKTGPFRTTDPTRAIAEPLYRLENGWGVRPRGVRGTAAGGWFSTPRDMLRIVRAIRDGRIVPPPALAEMLVSRTKDLPDSGTDYGYGFILENGGGTPSWGHGGIAPGVNSEIRYFPGPDITLVLFGNQDSGAWDDLRRHATRLVSGER
jgi:CubicO group peptidase (beta-lactamase class C family)